MKTIRCCCAVFSLLFLVCFAWKVRGEKIFVPPYEDCHCWEESAGLVDTRTWCNAGSGGIAIFAQAFLGGAVAEARQYVVLYVAPESSSRPIHIHAEIDRVGGVMNFGIPSLGSTEQTLSVNTLSNYFRWPVNPVMTPELAFWKAADFVCWVVPGFVAAEGWRYAEYAEALIAAAHSFVTAKDFYDAGEHLPPGDFESMELDLDYTLPPKESAVPLWVGLRGNAGACVLGTTAAFSLGYVKQITISGVDPPRPPTVQASNSVVVGQTYSLSLVSEGNNYYEPVSYWVDWGDGTMPEWTAYYQGGQTANLTHTYSSVGYYVISCKAKERDNTIALNPTYTSKVVHVIYEPLAIPDFWATDREYCEMIRVSWTSVTNAAYYRLYHGNTLIASLTNTCVYDDYDIEPAANEAYYYLKACNSGQSSLECADNNPRIGPAIGRVKKPPFDHPTNVTATSWGSPSCEISLAWSPCIVSNEYSGCATYYSIYRTPDADPDETNSHDNAIVLATNWGAFNTSFKDVPPKTGGNNYYSYWVRAGNDCGLSDFSRSARGLLCTPAVKATNVQALGSCGRVTLTWNEVSFPNAGTYRHAVLRDGFRIAANAADGVFYDTTAEPGRTYQYSIEVSDPFGSCSPARSDPVSGSLLTLLPPANLRASDELYSARVRLEWDPVAGAQNYRILRHTQTNISSAAVLAMCSTNDYQDTAVDSQTTYYYWVESVHSNCYSAPTAAVSGSANWPPAISSLGLQFTNLSGCATGLLNVKLTSTDADNNPVRPIYNWRLNGQPIAALLLPFETPGEVTTRDYSGNANTGIVHGSLWAGKERLVHQCDSLKGWQSLQGALSLETNSYLEGRAAVCWQPPAYSTNKLLLELGESQDWWPYDQLDMWLRASNSFYWLKVDPTTAEGQMGASNWWRPSGLNVTWNRKAGLIGGIASNVVHDVNALWLSCWTAASSPKVYFDQLRLARTNGPGGVYAFDGVDDYLEVPDSPSLALSNAITVEAWIYPKGQASHFGYIASKYVWENGQRSWIFYLDYPTPRLWIYLWPGAGANDGVGWPGPLSLNNWHHVAFTYNGSLLQLYVDGSAVASRTIPFNSIARSTSPIRIGNNPQSDTGINPFNGLIGDVRIYNRALSAAQIRQRWLDMGGGAADSAGLVAEETAPGQVWNVQVTPSDGIVDGNQTNSASLAILPAPTNLWASREAAREGIQLTWDAVSGATNYLVWRSEAGDDPAAATLISAVCPVNSFHDTTDLSCGTNYYYWVAAQSSGAMSWPSASVIGSANCAPVISSVALASARGTTYVVESMRATAACSDADNNPVGVIYNWLINTQEIAVAILPFETPGGTNTRDYTSFHNDGSLYGSPQWKPGTTKGPGASYELDGTNDFIEILPSSSLVFTSAVTIEAWLYPYGQEAHDGLIVSQGFCGSGQNSFSLLLRTNGLLVQLYDDSGASDSLWFEKVLTNNAWHQVLLQFEIWSQTATLIVDGYYLTNQYMQVTNLALTSAPIRIGANPDCGDLGFRGLIGDFRIYRRTLFPPTVSVRWFSSMRNGKADCNLLPGSEVGVDQKLQVKVTASDGIVDSDETTSAEITVLSAEPVFIRGPASQSVPEGSTVVLSVEASGMLPMGFQWKLNAEDIFWQVLSNNVSFYTITNITTNQAGVYTVLATNNFYSWGVESPPGEVTVIPDTDKDGMPDDWESANGLNWLDPLDGSMDSDGDGFSNLQEYLAGTDLYNPTSYLKLDISLEETGLGARFKFTAASNRTYSILTATNLLSTAWQRYIDIAARTNAGPIAITNQLQGPGAHLYRLCTPGRPAN